jgi:error-prone DNA polymerase
LKTSSDDEFDSGVQTIPRALRPAISNAIIHPKGYERNQMAVTAGNILMVEGLIQKQDSVLSVKASAVRVLDFRLIDMRSHDFH